MPDYRVEEYAERDRLPWCVCVFVIDEGQKLLDQLSAMAPLADRIDVVVADGGSQDGSTARANLAPRQVHTLLTKTGPGRLSAQMRMAFHHAVTHGYQGVVTIDGNGKDDVSAIPDFIAALEAGWDHLQGSRFVPGGRAVNTPWERMLGIRLVHAPLVSLAARHRYTDTTNGFRGYSRRLLLDPRVAPFRKVFSDYEMHYYLAIRAARLGFRVKELPVTRAYPDGGPTPTKIHGLSGNAKVFRTLMKACLHRYDPGS